MKVRIEDQRIVYRLSEMDRKRLLAGRVLEVSIIFGSSAMLFFLELDPIAMEMDFRWSGSEFKVSLPKLFVEDWPEKQVGYNLTKKDNGTEFTVSVEKDLKRSKRREH